MSGQLKIQNIKILHLQGLNLQCTFGMKLKKNQGLVKRGRSLDFNPNGPLKVDGHVCCLRPSTYATSPTQCTEKCIEDN